MPTLHELLISSAAARTEKPAVAGKTAQAHGQAIVIDSEGVEKLASILAGVETPNATLKGLLEKTALALRTLNREKAFLVDKLAERMQKDDASKVAQDLLKRQLISEQDVQSVTEKVALMDNLDAVKQAIDLVHTPKKELPLGTVEKTGARGAGGDNESASEKWLKNDPAAQYLLEQAGVA